MMLVSELGGKYELGFIVLIAHFILKREDSFLCATVLCFSILINQQLKLTFGEPRPFFVRPGPPGTPCDDLEFGNPSGHAIAFTSLMLVFKDGLNNTLVDLNFYRLQIFVLIVTWLLISVVIFSRFYFGVHSID
jgi:membrane-associated phospholipid phosphatase